MQPKDEKKNNRQNSSKASRKTQRQRNSNRKQGNKQSRDNKSARNEYSNEERNQNTENTGNHNNVLDQAGKPNHVEWYNQIPNLYEPAFSVATLPTLGYDLTRLYQSENVKLSTQDPFAMAGIMSLGFIPTIGESTDINSPINQVAQYMWKKFRTGLTSNGWYEPVDIMMYVLAADSIYMMISSLIRLYGVATWYVSTNRFVPERIIAAMGFDPADPLVNGSLPLLRMEINKLIMKMSTYHIPQGFHYIERHCWLSMNVFADGPEGDNAQLYVFYPRAYWKAALGQATETRGGAYLGLHYLPGTPADVQNVLSVTEYVEEIHDCINRMQEVLDALKLSAEVDRVFQGNIHAMKQIEEGYTIRPTHNENMLQQIKNLVVLESGTFNIGNVYTGITDYGTPMQRTL